MHTVKFYLHKNASSPIYTTSVPHGSLLDAPQVALQGWTFEKWNNRSTSGPNFSNPINADTDYYASWVTTVNIDEIKTNIGHTDGTTVGNTVSYGFLPIKGIVAPRSSEIYAIVTSGTFKHGTANHGGNNIHRFMLSMTFAKIQNSDVGRSSGGCILYGDGWKAHMTDKVLTNSPDVSAYNNAKNPWYILGGTISDLKTGYTQDDSNIVGNPDAFNPPKNVIPLTTREQLAHNTGSTDAMHIINGSVEDAKHCVLDGVDILHPCIVFHKCLETLDYHSTSSDNFEKVCNLTVAASDLIVHMTMP